VKFRATVGVLAVALIVTACSSDPSADRAAPRTSAPATTSPTPSATPTPAPPPPPQRSLLSGRLGKPNGRVVAVKIDNTAKSHPQAGLRQADVVYVEQVEGGATRLAAVYSSDYPRYVGPVRSARISDIELLRQYGRVKLIYSGSQNRLKDNLFRAKLGLVAYDYNPSGFSRSNGRPAPYDVIGHFPTLIKRASESSRPTKAGYTFGPPPPGGARAWSVKVHYPLTTIYARWSGEKRRWLLWMDGRQDMAAEGGQLGPTTFIVQYTRITRSIYHDVNGANTPETHTVGTGKALIFRNGRVYHAEWHRKKPWHITTWTINGKPASLSAGQVWIAMAKPGSPVSISR